MIKLINLAIVAFALLLSLSIGQPALADRGKFMKSPDYTEVTQSINALLQAKDDPESDISTDELQQQMGNLQLQKYILETSDERASCTNATGKNLAVYLRPKKAPATQASTLYYLGANQTTDDDFTCTGIYLPAESQAVFGPLLPVEELADPIALKIVEGTQFTATANPEGVLAFDAPAQIIPAGTSNWVIPTLTQADIDTQRPNAPQD